jgi:hypothetical protein
MKDDDEFEDEGFKRDSKDQGDYSHMLKVWD